MLKKCIWNEAINKIKKNLIENPSTIKKFIKIKIKSYGDEATDFHDKEMHKAGSNYTCLAVMLIGFVLKNDENYYPQMFLKEWKYIEKKVIRHVTVDL